MANKKPAAQVNAYDEELAQFAQQYGSMEEGSTGSLPFISTKGGRLTFNGGEVPDGVMNVIVLDHIFENHFYDSEYDADNPTAPVCFAFADKLGELAPHELSTAPQCENCAECPMNVFGSADRGKGKACKNIRRLCLLTEEDLEDIENATPAYLKVPVTSVKAWAGYVQQLSNVMKRPPFAVITEVSIVPDAKSTFRLLFKVVEEITDKNQIKELIAKREAIQAELRTPYTGGAEAEEEKPVRGRAKPAPRAAKAPPARPAARPAARAAKPAPAPARPAARAAKAPPAKPAAKGRKF